MGRMRAALGVALALAVMTGAVPVGHADLGEEGPTPVVSPGLLRDLQQAWVGGKDICGASFTEDGTAARYFVNLPTSSNVPDRSGYYSRDLRSGAEAMLADPGLSPSLACGVTSGDGNWYAFVDPFYGYDDDRQRSVNALFVLDLATLQTKLIATGVATGPVLFSQDNRFVFFMSSWSEPANGAHPPAVFRYDLEFETLEPATVAADGSLPNSAVDEHFAVSANGEQIAFATPATNLGSSTSRSRLFVRDLRAGSTTLVTADDETFSEESLLFTDDGSWVFYDEYGFPPPTGKEYETVHVVGVEVATGRRTVMVQTPSGDLPNMSTHAQSVTGDGRFLVFSSDSTDLVDDVTYPPPPNEVPPIARYRLRLYILDTNTGRVRLISRSADGTTVADSGAASVSVDRVGALVIFDSDASNLVAGYQGNDAQVYAYRVATGRVELTSRGPGENGTWGGDAISPMVSATGRRVLFSRYDYFIPDWLPYVTTLPQLTVTIAAPEATAPYGSPIPTLFEPTYAPAIYVGSAFDAAPTCSTTAHTGVDVGSYLITCSGAVPRDLDLRYVNGTFTVTPAPTRLDDTGFTLDAASPLDPIRASTRLSSVVTGRGLAGEVVVFSIGNWTCQATTHVDGVATCPVPKESLLASAGSVLTARYDGAQNYEATDATMSPPSR